MNSEMVSVFVMTVKSPFNIHTRFFPHLMFNSSSGTSDRTHGFPPLKMFSVYCSNLFLLKINIKLGLYCTCFQAQANVGSSTLNNVISSLKCLSSLLNSKCKITDEMIGPLEAVFVLADR